MSDPAALGCGPPLAAVEQGPAWLARWALCPPPWAVALVVGLGLAVAAAVGWRLRRRGWTVDASTQRPMLVVAWTAALVMLATAAASRWLAWPYLADVGLGFIAGYGAVLAAQTAAARGWAVRVVSGPRDRLTAAWAGLAFVAALGPAVVGLTVGPAASLARWWLVVLAGGLVVLNGHQSL